MDTANFASDVPYIIETHVGLRSCAAVHKLCDPIRDEDMNPPPMPVTTSQPDAPSKVAQVRTPYTGIAITVYPGPWPSTIDGVKNLQKSFDLSDKRHGLSRNT